MTTFPQPQPQLQAQPQPAPWDRTVEPRSVRRRVGVLVALAVLASSVLVVATPATPAAAATCPPAAAAPFPDVPASHPFCQEISTAKAFGAVDGFPDGTFRPGQSITRQAVAAILSRFPDPIPLPGCPALPFVDVPEHHPFCTNIMALKLMGVADGFPDGTFRPAHNITRQAFVALLVRWIDAIDMP